jgi:hypothetical protein
MPIAVWWLASKDTASALRRAEAANCRAAVLNIVCVGESRGKVKEARSISKLKMSAANQAEAPCDDPMSQSRGLAAGLAELGKTSLWTCPGCCHHECTRVSRC